MQKVCRSSGKKLKGRHGSRTCSTTHRNDINDTMKEGGNRSQEAHPRTLFLTGTTQPKNVCVYFSISFVWCVGFGLWEGELCVSGISSRCALNIHPFSSPSLGLVQQMGRVRLDVAAVAFRYETLAAAVCGWKQFGERYYQIYMFYTCSAQTIALHSGQTQRNVMQSTDCVYLCNIKPHYRRSTEQSTTTTTADCIFVCAV